MSEYSSRTNKLGRQMYYKGNKLVAFKDIPETAVILDKDFETFEGEETVDPTPGSNATVQPEAISPPTKVCIACGEDGEYERFINLQTIYLCKDHYETLTTGEVVETMRKTSEHSLKSN